MILYNAPMKTYLDHENYGSTSFKEILTSPADFKAKLEQKSVETKATSRGTLVHVAMSEPHLLHKIYAFQKEDWGPRNKGDGAKKWKSLKAECEEEGKTPVGYEDYLFIQRLLSIVEKTPYLKELLKKCRAEVTAFCDFENVPLKARCDLLNSKENIIWDIKTTSKGMNDDALGRTVFNMGYHFQLAHQMQVFLENDVDITRWGWIFVSTDTPEIHISMKEASIDWVKSGFHDFMYAIELYNECVQNSDWYGFSNDKPELLYLPDYVKKNYEE